MFAHNHKNIGNPQFIEDFLNFAKLELSEIDNPSLEAELLMCFALGKSRTWIKINNKESITENEESKFREILEKRKNNIPMAYILGYKIWNDLKIEVSPNVLIPRDETDILANYIIKNSRDFEVKNILDIGTGSGCIAIFMAKNFPDAQITALDISTKALKIAKKNAKNNDVKIYFIKSDLLNEISFVNSLPDKGEREGVSKIPRKFDIIIANLPYVPEDIEVEEDVKKEPYNAIFSGEDGLDLIRKLAEQLKSREILFQELWLEFLPQQKKEITKIFDEFSVEFYPDLGGEIYFARIT